MHSLRVGSTQDLLAEGFSDAQIMNVLRWKKPSIFVTLRQRACQSGAKRNRPAGTGTQTGRAD